METPVMTKATVIWLAIMAVIGRYARDEVQKKNH